MATRTLANVLYWGSRNIEFEPDWCWKHFKLTYCVSTSLYLCLTRRWFLNLFLYLQYSTYFLKNPLSFHSTGLIENEIPSLWILMLYDDLQYCILARIFPFTRQPTGGVLQPLLMWEPTMAHIFDRRCSRVETMGCRVKDIESFRLYLLRPEKVERHRRRRRVAVVRERRGEDNGHIVGFNDVHWCCYRVVYMYHYHPLSTIILTISMFYGYHS